MHLYKCGRNFNVLPEIFHLTDFPSWDSSHLRSVYPALVERYERNKGTTVEDTFIGLEVVISELRGILQKNLTKTDTMFKKQMKYRSKYHDLDHEAKHVYECSSEAP